MTENMIEISDDNGTIIEHRLPFSYELFYDNYNNIRLSKILLFESILSDYKEFTKLNIKKQKKLLIDIEKTCFNHTIDLSNKNNIIPSWDNIIFIETYHSSFSRLAPSFFRRFLHRCLRLRHRCRRFLFVWHVLPMF